MRPNKSSASGMYSCSGSSTSSPSRDAAASGLSGALAVNHRLPIPRSLAGSQSRPCSDSGPAAEQGDRLLHDARSLLGVFDLYCDLPSLGLRLLVVDDDLQLRTTYCKAASQIGFVSLSAGTVPEALAVLREQQPVDLVLLDLKLPGGDGLKLLGEIKALHPHTGVVIMTAFATVPSAVEAMRTGADDYLTKPFGLEQLTTVLHQSSRRFHFDLQSRRLRERLRTERGMGNLIGTSPGMEKVYRILSKVAMSTHPVLILGESGTGKEVVAQAIHASGPHASRPFVPVDCCALVPTLIESELFGHVKGAFTGANMAKQGLLAAAGGGTVFLDEIGELPLDLQAKLLRALQEKEVRSVGATHAVPISARVLAATNRDLNAMVAQGLFRKDLYYRLNVLSLKIPPLRDRREDIALLAEYFLERVRLESGTPHSFSEDALRLMTEYDWPGNVRELQHAIEHACAMSSEGEFHATDLPTHLQEFRTSYQEAAVSANQAGGGVPNAASNHCNGIVSICEMEKQAIIGTIRQLEGDKLMAARLLGIGKTTLYRKLKEYGLPLRT